MIRIASIEIRGKSMAGEFAGGLTFDAGLQVISGPNGFGKTLAAESIAWCLNLELVFGKRDSDSSFFPEAVLEEIDFPGAKGSRVLSTEARLTLERHDGERLWLTRALTHDQNKIRIARFKSGAIEAEPTITLTTGIGSLVDASVGFQNYLFDWLGWPRKRATTFEGKESHIYLENLAPLFYVEQQDGWTQIQARQIGRYGQQQIKELAVEYLLGASDAVDYRVARQRTATLESTLREAARGLAERAKQVFLKQGWAVDWSGHGSLNEITARWSGNTLRDTLKRDAEVDIGKQREDATARMAVLRRIVTSDPVDPANMSAASSASQLVVDLKQRRHKLNFDLRALTSQHEDHEHLFESLIHRIRTASDVHRLKTTGVGRLAHLECPTCHRELDADAFTLTEQTAPQVEAHIEALKRDRLVTRQTLAALQAAIRKTEAEISKLDVELHNGQRALEDVNASVGSVREQIVRAAANLSAQERLVEKLDETAADLDLVQGEINAWLLQARAAESQSTPPADLDQRLSAFRDALGQYLVALGHSAVMSRGVGELRLDAGQYEPYLGHRRLSALGSGSDPARLVAAYTLALAAASATDRMRGLHPGVVILDEPLQQNPDTAHVELLLEFLSHGIAKEARFQTLVFTFLTDDRVEALRARGTNVKTVEGHLLSLVPPPAVPAQPNDDKAADRADTPDRRTEDGPESLGEGDDIKE